MKNRRGTRGSRFTSAITLIIAILAAIKHFLLTEEVDVVANVANYLM